MPAEAIRLERRLAARDRWFLILLALAVVAGSAAALAAARYRSSDARSAGCVSITRASWMGAATFKACGADAAAFCRRSAGRDGEVAAKCRDAGLPAH